MRSPSCKGPRLRRAILGLVVCMFIGFFGCGGRLTPKEAAAQHLDKKYGGSFTVRELTKKENGPFKTAAYSGFAYETGRPLERFTVWVSSDCKTVYDARYTVAMLPSVNKWVQSLADGLWQEAETAVVVDALSYSAQAEAGITDFETFYRQESANNTVLLAVNTDENLTENVISFLASLDGVMTGYVRIYLDDGNDLEALLTRPADAEIMIGSSEHVIREKTEGL